MSGRGDFAKDYIEVSERITKFYAKYPEGSLQSRLIELTDSRVVMEASAYRTPDDPRPGIGYSSLGIPGATPYTRGSEIENCETSAWGRAIAALGFEVKRGVASADEIRNKSADTPSAGRPSRPSARSQPSAADASAAEAATLTGKIARGAPPVDAELRATTDGDVFGFALIEPSQKRVQVLGSGPMALALAMQSDNLVGKEATVSGQLVMVPWQKDGKDMPPYRRLLLEHITTPDFEVPAAPDGPVRPANQEAVDAELDALLPVA